MSRRIRLQYAGAIYHVVNRGNRQEDIFLDDSDRETFLRTLGETCAKTSWKVHAYCLMPNHFHLVMETPQANLVVGMKWLLGTYTSRFNRRHQMQGHLFAGRYQAQPVSGEGGYLRQIVDFVHLNPDRAGLLRATDNLADYPWSSLPFYTGAEKSRPSWIHTFPVLKQSGVERDDEAGRISFAAALENRRGHADAGSMAWIQDSWFLGDEAFHRFLLARLQTTSGPALTGQAGREAAQVRAEGIVQEELSHLGWHNDELFERRKGDPDKIRIAKRLRNQTTVTMQWIADRLGMGAKTHLVHLLYWNDKEKPRTPSHPRVAVAKSPRIRPETPPASLADHQPTLPPTPSIVPDLSEFDIRFD